MAIPKWLEIVKQIKLLFDKFVINKFATANNITILRLPPYNRELNSIELVWSSVMSHIRINNIT